MTEFFSALAIDSDYEPTVTPYLLLFVVGQVSTEVSLIARTEQVKYDLIAVESRFPELGRKPPWESS
ncbi:hypothetical protein GCM10027052_02610 [Parafrigoribacterium mesophilum]